MKEKSKTKKPRPQKGVDWLVKRLPWLKGLLVYLASIVVILLVLFGVFSLATAGKIYPRVSVAGVMVGSLRPNEAKAKLEAALPQRTIHPAILTIEDGRSFTIKPEDIGASYNTNASVDEAMQVGRSPNWFTAFVQKVTTPIFGLEIPAKVNADQAKFDVITKKLADEINIPEKDAALVIKNGQVSIAPAATGKIVKIDVIKEQVLAAFGNEESTPIRLMIETKEPKIREEGVEAAKKQAEAVLRESLLFTYQAEKTTATPSTIGEWLETKPFNNVLKSQLELHFNEEKIDAYIASLTEKIDKPAINARLAIVNGQVNIIESSKDGLKVKRDVAKADIIRVLSIRKELPAIAVVTESPTINTSPSDSLVSPSPEISPEIAENQIVLEVEVKKPDVTDDNINQLGIKERIAVATTDFKNSPANRQENIRLGAKLFNGIILKPGDQFSAVKSLGRIDASAGFKPELVIKQDQLTPEIGGGLCQISTTLFRSVMNAGLKIDERRNHRFRVSYYEARPAVVDPEDYVTLNAKTLVGLDATIYDPSPDFTFTNDTVSYVLIQGRVEGTRLTFELFGTKDGRKVAIDGPYITSTTPAPSEIKYIDDPTLPAGVTKVKERAVGGSKTYFTYMVEKDGKQIHKNTFGSSYVPWQAKHYRGTGAAVSPSPSPEVSPTPAVQGTTTETPSPFPSVAPTPAL